MKKFVSFFLSLAFAGSTFAQMSGYSSSQSDGTTLGANETLTANGIALGNAVKLRGYVDFMYGYRDMSEDLHDHKSFDTSADVDFLFDLSPITAELHLNVSDGDSDLLEQAFGRYSLNQDFHITFGRQVTNLGYDSDEVVNRKSVTTSYFFDQFFGSSKTLSAFTETVKEEALEELINGGTVTIDGVTYTNASLVSGNLPAELSEDLTNLVSQLSANLRKNYVDGIRANYNNGMFGLSFGIHDGYWKNDDFNDNVAIDLAASVMFFPGLEARLGYAHQDNDDQNIGHLNGWIAYNPGDLTLAFEFDNFDFDGDTELWDIMLMANYQFTDFIGVTFRYSHEDAENFIMPYDLDWTSDRFTLALLFSVTENFGINVEYSHTEYDGDGWDDSADEFYVQGLISY